MNLKLITFLPDILLFFLAIYLLFTNAYRSSLTTERSTFLPFFLPKVGYYSFLALEGGALLWGWVMSPISGSLIFDIFYLDHLVLGAKLIIFMLGVSWLGLREKGIVRSFQRENMRSFEYPSLLLFSMVGSFLLVSAAHLGAVMVGLALQTIPIFIAICLYEDNTSSVVWATRYFILEGICFSFFHFGVALLYGVTGDLSFKTIATAQTSFSQGTPDLRIVIGFFMIFGVFLLRLGAFPFHLWVTKFHEASSNLVVPFLFTIYFSSFIAFGRMLLESFSALNTLWTPFLFWVGLSSSLWGAIGALFQTNIRSFFSYNYIFHLGMVLLGLSAGGPEGFHASLLYWVVYTLSVGTFFFFWAHLSENDQMLNTVDQATGLGIKHPAFTLLIALTLLSLASIPPFAGFWCKLYILKTLMGNGGGYITALLIFTIIASFQYFHIIRSIYFSEGIREINVSYDWRTLWTLLPILLVGFFLFQDKIFDFIPLIARGF